MTKQEFDLMYRGNKAVHCDTEEKANEFLELAHRFGYKWASGDILTNLNYWNQYQKRTCYTLDDTKDSMMASTKNYYEEEGYTIVKFELENGNNKGE